MKRALWIKKKLIAAATGKNRYNRLLSAHFSTGSDEEGTMIFLLQLFRLIPRRDGHLGHSAGEAKLFMAVPRTLV